MHFRFLLMAGFAALSLAACSTEEDTLDKQRTAIETYLESKEMEIDDDLRSKGVYRYIANIDREDRGTEPQVEKGDSVVIDYALYLFTSGTGPSTLYYTNVPELQDLLENFDPEMWPHLPQRVKVGSTSMMKGLELGLTGARRNDNLELYLTYNNGFGKGPVGLVSPESPLVWQVYIYDVIKQ